MLLVAVPLPLVVGLSLFQPGYPRGGEAAFLLAVVAFAVGTLLLLV